MSTDVGHTWRKMFRGEAGQSAVARRWVRDCITEHIKDTGTKPDPERVDDLVQLTAELFRLVLTTESSVILLTLSTSGTRARITAAGSAALPHSARHGMPLRIVDGIAGAVGLAAQDRAMWADLSLEARQ